MSNLGFPTRRRLWIFVALCLSVIAPPAFFFLKEVTACTSSGMPTTFAVALRFEDGGNEYVARDLSWNWPFYKPVGKAVGDVTINVSGVGNIDPAGQLLYAKNTFTTTWFPSRPSDEVIDGILRTWGNSTGYSRVLRDGVEQSIGKFALNDVLKSPSGVAVHRDWKLILSSAWASASRALLACGGLGLPILIAAFFFLRRKAHREGACRTCGYSTAGLTTNVCPECGVDPNQPPK